MEHKEPITLEDKKRMYSFFFQSEEGKVFVDSIRDMHSMKLDIAQSAYLKLQCPNEQIAANVNQASGIKEVLDFIDSIEREVKEDKKKKGDQ